MISYNENKKLERLRSFLKFESQVFALLDNSALCLFDDIDWPKTYIILYPSLGNLTTHIAITPDSVCEDDSPICTESTMLRYCIIPDYKKKCCQSCLDA